MRKQKKKTAICVQRFDDSLIYAIHTTFRNLLRSSSMHKPRDPLSKFFIITILFLKKMSWYTIKKFFYFANFFGNDPSAGSPTETLLRLLLLLKHIVWATFAPQINLGTSKDLTKCFNQ